MNLYDILLARCICSNKEDESITVTPLEVTENGEYEAEEGYAYNPITVNVSSDFSTAQMTVSTITGSPYNWSFSVAVAADEPINGAVVATIVPANVGTFEIVLYKGAQFIFLNSDYVHDISGDITYDDGYYKVTGDCTVTLYSVGEA